MYSFRVNALSIMLVFLLASRVVAHTPEPPIIVLFNRPDAVIDETGQKRLAILADSWKHRLPCWAAPDGSYRSVAQFPAVPGGRLTKYPEGYVVVGYAREAGNDVQRDIRLGLERAKAVVKELSAMGLPEDALHVRAETQEEEADTIDNRNMVFMYSWFPPYMPP